MIKKIRVPYLFDTLLVFMLIFAFPLIPVFNSAKIALLISLLGVTFNTKLSKYIFNRVLCSNEFRKFIVLTLLFILYTFILTTFREQYDFSLFSKQFSSLIYSVFIIIFFSFFKRKNLFEIIIGAFVLQSLVILFCIFSQSFYDLTSSFRNEITDLQFRAYGRLRGNAMSGYQFFGISSMYGFVILAYILNKELNSLKNVLILILLIFVGVVSGRYTLVAIILGVVIKFVESSSHKKVRTLINLSVVLVVFYLVLQYLYVNVIDDELKARVDFYLVDDVTRYQKTGDAHTGSTNHLIEMYENFEIEKIFIGEGRYVGEDQVGYYGEVDAGYLRMLLYYGVTMVFLFYLQYLLMFKMLNVKLINYRLSLSFFVYFLLLNLKGDVFFYSNNVMPIIIGLIYFSTNNLKDKDSLKYERIV